jgi:hypothetical protein
VLFTATADGIWVKFYDANGTQLMQKQMVQGESYTVPAEANGPKIWTGRPEALAITIGGHAVPKLADVQKTMKDVPVSAAALLSRVTPVATPVIGPVTTPVAPAPVLQVPVTKTTNPAPKPVHHPVHHVIKTALAPAGLGGEITTVRVPIAAPVETPATVTVPAAEKPSTAAH